MIQKIYVQCKTHVKNTDTTSTVLIGNSIKELCMTQNPLHLYQKFLTFRFSKEIKKIY